jgi:hypothetical protein
MLDFRLPPQQIKTAFFWVITQLVMAMTTTSQLVETLCYIFSQN